MGYLEAGPVAACGCGRRGDAAGVGDVGGVGDGRGVRGGMAWGLRLGGEGLERQVGHSKRIRKTFYADHMMGMTERREMVSSCRA